MLDAAADDVAVGDGDHVGHAVATVDDDAGKGALVDLAASPGGGQCQHGLHRDIETWAENCGCLVSFEFNRGFN